MRSLRANLALTYAGIALLTAAVLGTILLAVLGNYYARAEDAYLRAAAQRIVADPPPAAQADIATWAQLAALSTQTRVRVYDGTNTLIADSGSPRDLDPRELAARDGGRRPEHGDRGELPAPLGRGIFGDAGAAAPRSNRTLTLGITGGQGGTVQVSEAPASGREALVGVAQAWTLAALLAVGLAALAGYLLSSRISRPIVTLTEASDLMAEGDLSARASVVRDDEVGRLAESFNEMADRIETTVAALRRFVADAAHEIGTPLTALQADLELAQRAATTTDERRLVDRALAQARRLEDLSGNLLRLSRIEAGESPSEAESADVGIVARQAADTVASRAEQAGIELVVDLGGDSLAVAIDPTSLLTVIGNLLDNAVKFTPEGGTVTLAAHAENGSAVIEVSDTGVGIPEAEQADVFSRFHRARNVHAYAGSGLGLAIVRASVERAGGSVGFVSSEGGTTFRVVLPLAD